MSKHEKWVPITAKCVHTVYDHFLADLRQLEGSEAGGGPEAGVRRAQPLRRVGSRSRAGAEQGKS